MTDQPTGNNTSLSSCETRTLAIFSDIYKGVITGELTAACLALTPNVLLTLVIWRVTVFPVNLRLLLGQFSFSLTWLALGNIIKTSYVLSAPPCAYQISQRACKMFDVFTTSLPLSIVYYSLVALCVERMFASVIYKRYENVKWHKKPYLAYALIIISHAVAVMVSTLGLPSLSTAIYVAICESNFTPSTSPPYLAQIYLSAECTAALITAFIYFYNRRVASSMAINRALYNLSSRFMVDQNVQINAIVVPSMTLHFLSHIPAFTIGHIQQAIADRTTKAWVARTTVLLRLIYAIMHPVLAFYFSAHLRQQLLDCGPIGCLLQRFGVKGVTGGQQQKAIKTAQEQRGNTLAVHFDHLDKVWALAKPSGNRNMPGNPRAAWAEQDNSHPCTIEKQPRKTRF